MPLIANHALHVDPEFEDWCAWPNQLRKVTLQLQSEYLADQPHIEPEEVAPEDDRETDLPRLNDAFTTMLDQVFVSRASNEYLNCDRVDCDSCPFNEDPGCGVMHLREVLKTMQGYNKFM